MNLALEQGRLALPGSLPTPYVGCVIVRHRTVIANGHTHVDAKSRPGRAFLCSPRRLSMALGRNS
jgi:pyrimidine deaminase RibD-like protein